MSKEMDEMREEVAKKLHLQELKSVPEDSPIYCGWNMLSDNFKLMYRQDADQILSLETDTAKIAVISKITGEVISDAQ